MYRSKGLPSYSYYSTINPNAPGFIHVWNTGQERKLYGQWSGGLDLPIADAGKTAPAPGAGAVAVF